MILLTWRPKSWKDEAMEALEKEAVDLFVVVVLCLWAAVAEAEYLKYKDPKQPLNAMIKDLMGRMTLEEKIGQMSQIERKLASPDVMKNSFIGSVLSGGGSVPAPKASAEDWVNMVNELQKGSLSTRLGIPMIYGIDAVRAREKYQIWGIFKFFCYNKPEKKIPIDPLSVHPLEDW